MDTSTHLIDSLFLQLGLPNSKSEIAQFIKAHQGIPANIPLWEAEFWSISQAAFIKESIEQDSDWAEAVDHMDVQLRN